MLELSCNWLDRLPKPSSDELEATLAAVRILIGKKNVTEYVTYGEHIRSRADEQTSDKLHVPAYYLAEWIAENWWPLLFEPPKTDDVNIRNPDYDERHSIVSSQHGFALPAVTFQPAGDFVQVSCFPRDVPAAGVRFRTPATQTFSRAAVTRVLKEFVDRSVERLSTADINGTPLQHAWEAVSGTTKGETVFCQLAGALGVSPYAVSDSVSEAIGRVFDVLGSRAAFDLCMASSESCIVENARTIEYLTSKLQVTKPVDLTPLANFVMPPDNVNAPAWIRGKNTAIRVRQVLQVGPFEDRGADRIFDALHFSTGAMHFQDDQELAFPGVLERVESGAQIVLAPQQTEKRRFAAGRALFLALDTDKGDRRLLTNAVSREQQASRAFAAEVLVPSNYIKQQAKHARLSPETVFEIANARRADLAVVGYQATNNGLVVDT